MVSGEIKTTPAQADTDRNGAPMNTRTIAIIALVIAALLLIVFVILPAMD